MEKRNSINLNINNINNSSLLYSEEIIDPIFYHNIMTQKINKRRDIVLPNEINKRKKIIYELLKSTFGPFFIERNANSLNSFESLFGKYLFSAKSTFLKKFFPDLYNKYFGTKKLDVKNLKKKIDIGQMMYLSIRKNLVSNKSSMSDKLLYISKNFSRKDVKDLVSNLYYKYKSMNEKKKRAKKFKNKNSHFSAESIHLGNKSRVKNYTSNEKNKDNLNNIKDIKKVIFNMDLENENKRLLLEKSDKSKNKDINMELNNKQHKMKLKINLSKSKDNNLKKSFSKNFEIFSSEEKKENKYNNLYLSNPYYIYNSNIINRNNTNKYKNSLSEISTINSGNFISPQISLKSNNSNINFPNSILKPSKFFKSHNFHLKNNSISTKYKTISSFKNLEYNPKYINNIKMIKYNNISNNNHMNNNNILNFINDENDESEILSKKEKNEIKKDDIYENLIDTNKKNKISLKHKLSFDKFLKNKSKRFKTRLNSEVLLLNKFTDKCNNKLIKLIDRNFLVSSKEKIKNENKKVNFDITKLLLDDKLSKKVIQKFNKTSETIKPIVKRAIKDSNKFDKRNLNYERKNFIKNINHMNDDLILFFIDELYKYKTNHIKFELKEFAEKRKEKKKIEEENKIKNIRHQAKHNLFKMQQLEYNLMNEKNE